MKKLIAFLFILFPMVVSAENNVVPGTEKIVADETGRIVGYQVDLYVRPYGRFTIALHEDEMPFPTKQDGSFDDATRQAITDFVNKKAAVIRARQEAYDARQALREQKTEEATSKAVIGISDADVNKAVILEPGTVDLPGK